ncbi:flagellar hook-basal body protein [Sporosarcina highlanderae]|uniref:Flagellar hook-basal body protein n=1 Tax=Sporosarcina highlanderae TaxID=3035916 RepID=A0ABT8JLS0_9BACL|nr:flagellar hook-basal body protein [Sporosarcina highlanderae]MDN4605982.1 flagellar hook-basal body protein [Sporosarcina highlanderae]
MIRSMATAVNTMNQLQSQIDIIGNNLANSSTHGYKSGAANFQEMLYQQFNNDKGDTAQRQSPAGIRYGVGAMLGSVQMNTKVGSLQATNRELDFALTEPKHYFNLIRPTENGEQTVYTRQGNFFVTPVEGGNLMLVNGDGYPVANSAGEPIVFSDNVEKYTLLPEGILQVTEKDQAIREYQMGITKFERPNLMNRLSATLFSLPDNMDELGVTPDDVIVEMIGANRSQIGMENGQLEASNVDYQKEMTDLISVQRSYQFNARTVTLADQMLGLINNIR